jgi:hypothetical protein
MTGRTRVFYDDVTGLIAEADVAINPHPVSAEGATLQFSTDGSSGTYDLESTFTHELGHLMGLEHSAVVASSMQPRQGVNGVYKLPALTERTLSEDDREKARAIYGPHENSGTIEGRILSTSLTGASTPLSGAHVWAENRSSGRVIASNITSANGSYRLESVPPGQYRVLAQDVAGSIAAPEPASGGMYESIESQRAFRSAEIVNPLRVVAGVTSTLIFVLVPPQSSARFLNPRFIGTNGDLSTMPVPVEAGKKLTLYVGGEGVDQVSGRGISVTSPFFTVDPASLTLQQFGTAFPVISFDVTVAANAQFGDYSIRLQSNSGELAYVAGGITIDPGADSALPNVDDDPRFFVSHHYRDFLGREPDRQGLDYWVNELTQCERDSECLHRRRLAISAAFFVTTEFQETGSFFYGLYKAALGRRPGFAEFSADQQLTGVSSDLSSTKQDLALAFVQRSEFSQKYPNGMSAEQFTDAVLSTVWQHSEVDLSAERGSLIKLYDGTPAGRATIVRRMIENPAFRRVEYNREFVLMQYFGYLRRDPDAAGYEFWVNVLNKKLSHDPTGYRAAICAFTTSAEYQLRFGMILTHNNSECGP